MSDIRGIVTSLIADGHVVLPVKPGEKATRFPKWSDPDIRPGVADFAEGDNIAMRLDGWIDVDNDCRETRAVAPALLLHTEMRHGRPSVGVTHYWYTPLDGAIKSEQFKDIDGQVLVELRSGHTHYTLIPPSVVLTKDANPTPEALYWDQCKQPARVDPAGLRESVRLVAVVALVIRHWPRGGRHNLLLALAGFLAGQRVHDRAALDALSEITRVAEGDVWSDCAACVSNSYASFANGGKTTGLPTLEGTLGADVAKRLGDWFGGGAKDSAIDEMNKKHFVIRIGKDELIGHEDGRSFVFQQPAALRTRYANQLVHAGTKPGKPKKDGTPGADVPNVQNKFDVWLKHPRRREYRTVTFAPPPIEAHPEDLNLWRGFAVEPDDRPNPAERCARLLWHIEHIVCAGVAEHYAYLMDLLALGVQRPGERSEIATILQGPQGAGKGIFIRAYCDLFGREHSAHLDKPEQLAGKFNAHLSGKVVVFADEAFFAGDRSMSGPLKRLITEPTIQIERKGVDQYDELNCIHLFMATNSDWAVPSEFRERRHFVLTVADTVMQDHDYFEQIAAERAAGGLGAFLAVLLARPIDRKRLRKAPETTALREQQALTMAHERRWWRECLLSGMIGAEPWPAWIGSDDLFWAYINYCDALKINRRASNLELFKRLKPFFEHATPRKQTACFRDDRGKVDPTYKVSKRGWALPPLSEMRQTFDLVSLGAGKKGAWPILDAQDVPDELTLEGEDLM